MMKRFGRATEGFEPLYGQVPLVVLDEHPSREFVAMRVSPATDVYGERSAIWSTKSRKLVWIPENVNALCWTPDGQGVLLAREFYQRQPGKHDIIVTPLQSEYSHFLELLSWPGKKPIDECEIDLPRGWIVDLLASPTGKLVCCVWNDQHEAGFELFSITERRVRQLDGQGYHGQYSNLLEGPVFSPGGRYLVSAYTNHAWWSPDDPETPSLGGQCKVGWIVVGDTATGRYQVLEVHKLLPTGWLPSNPNDFCYVLLSRPSFSDPDHFKIMLPTGEERSFSVSGG
jgi:hypothetical protein